jgi:sirohydrochlorin ferrochelatase
LWDGGRLPVRQHTAVTRFPPSRIAAVLASHGDRGGGGANRALTSCASYVRSLTGFRAVAAGVLKGEPSLEDALHAADAADPCEIVVSPLFMADGYFTGQVLPRRVAALRLASRVRILPPLGLDPRVADLAHTRALKAAETANFLPSRSRLLLVGHGSKFDTASADATHAAADRIARTETFASVAVAFLEEPPFLETVLAEPQTPTIVCGYFFGEGMHAGEDIPILVGQAKSPAIYTGPIGHAPELPPLIAAALLGAEVGAS